MPRVFIGVGHGGADPGAVGKMREKDANLTVALKMRQVLECHGVTVGMSRMADENDPIAEEVSEANAFRPDIACDVHANAGGGNGWEAYAQTGIHAERSAALAKAVEVEVKAIGQQSRGVKTRAATSGLDYYAFLRSVKCPAVILEGFFVDTDDALEFDTVAEQQALGLAYAKGILAYFGIGYREDGGKLPYHDAVQNRFGFADGTMEYLSAYKWAEPLLMKLATRG